jgi:hypothetical protein
VGRDGADIDLIWANREAEYFRKWDWTGQISLKSRKNFLPPRIASARLMAAPQIP